MTELENAGRELERLYRSALSVSALLEDLAPGDVIPERKWFLLQHMLQELTDSADDARAGLVQASLRMTDPVPPTECASLGRHEKHRLHR